MSFSQKKELDELENVISKAIKKVRGTKENDLCKYIPVTTGGYMHHFTLKKMKFKDPNELGTLIEKFILKVDHPLAVAPKRRAARGSRKKKEHSQFTRMQLDRLLNIARLAGDSEMINLLSPKKSLASAKRDLINAVRSEVVDHELWNSYVEAVNSHKAAIATGNTSALSEVN